MMKIGFAMCGSFCTMSKAIEVLEKLVGKGYDVVPIMSETAYTTDTRFGKAKEIQKKVERLTGKKIIHTIVDAEPIGPQNMTDVMIIAPCTGNTLAKLNHAITDTAVTMAVKSHLRQNKPVLIALATNDALGATARNIADMMNTKNISFVPMTKDDPENKPKSLVADFDSIEGIIERDYT